MKKEQIEACGEHYKRNAPGQSSQRCRTVAGDIVIMHLLIPEAQKPHIP